MMYHINIYINKDNDEQQLSRWRWIDNATVSEAVTTNLKPGFYKISSPNQDDKTITQDYKEIEESTKIPVFTWIQIWKPFFTHHL